MILLIAGIALLGMGLFAGGILVLAPVGVVAGSPDIVLWVLFPLFSIIGFTLFVIGSRYSQIRWMSFVASMLLLGLALASAAALVCIAASIVRPVGSTISLWYVFLVAGLVGAIGAASGGLASSSAQPGQQPQP